MELATARIITQPSGLTSTPSNDPCGLHRMLSLHRNDHPMIGQADTRVVDDGSGTSDLTNAAH
jgi:hypothetical protein